jgi:hypothetical protein
MLGIGRKKPANEPADLTAAQATPGAGAGSGKGSAKKPKGDDKQAPVNITINSTGKSGDAVDGKTPEKKFNYAKKS